MEVKIINLNDIEDIILGKREIELYLMSIGQIENKMPIDYFIEHYAMLKYAYVIGDKMIPFGLALYNNINYLFIINDNEKDIEELINKLKSMKYDINNKKEMSYDEIAELGSHPYLICDGKFYL